MIQALLYTVNNFVHLKLFAMSGDSIATKVSIRPQKAGKVDGSCLRVIGKVYNFQNEEWSEVGKGSVCLE